MASEIKCACTGVERVDVNDGRTVQVAWSWLPVFLVIACVSSCSGFRDSAESPYSGWYAYGGDAGGTRYAALDQIDRDNVKHLTQVWTYRTGELGQASPVQEKLTFEATPILFDGSLYLSTAFGKVIALDPATGEERWTHDPGIDRTRHYFEVTSRGVSAWHDREAGEDQLCAKRIFIGTIDARLIALDAATGKLCAQFGEMGQVDLAQGTAIEKDPEWQLFHVTSPPAIIHDLVIVGTSIADNWQADTGSGVVRAYHARTGELRWAWDPLPDKEAFTGPVGAANAWSIISADPGRDLVFVPTGSPSPDFYGGFRPGDNQYANSVVALRASTGEVVWHFQTVHHDLWDYDVAAQPALVTLRRDGRPIPAVVQATKMGSLFVLHRETGEPLFPVEERAVPQTDVPGERTWPTQPFSTLPQLMPLEPLTPDDAWGLTEAEREANREILARYRSEGIFTPPSLGGTVMYPGNASGVNWGSVAFDPERQLLVTNTSRYATLVQLIPRDGYEEARRSDDTHEFGFMDPAPYAVKRRDTLIHPPPWGTLVVVDLSSGEKRWEVPLGDIRGRTVGLANAGGPIVTSGGLVFIGATRDNRFRAFDVETGALLWSAELPLCAIATPMTYMADGRQFVVTAAGGHGKSRLPTGDHVIAFALP
jgi:quinoprotein glucose dehydrogenase